MSTPRSTRRPQLPPRPRLVPPVTSTTGRPPLAESCRIFRNGLQVLPVYRWPLLALSWLSGLVVGYPVAHSSRSQQVVASLLLYASPWGRRVGVALQLAGLLLVLPAAPFLLAWAALVRLAEHVFPPVNHPMHADVMASWRRARAMAAGELDPTFDDELVDDDDMDEPHPADERVTAILERIDAAARRSGLTPQPPGGPETSAPRDGAEG